MAKSAREVDPTERLKVIEMAAARYSVREIASKMDIKQGAVMTIVNSAKDSIDARRKQIDGAKAELGLRSRERRTDELEQLFEKIMQEQLETTWATETRVTSKGLKIGVAVFNAAAVREVRGILDDIAKESGGRGLSLSVGGDDKNGPIRVEAVNYLAAVAPVLSEKPLREKRADDVELTDEEMDEILRGD